jgi:hypothetical protein
MNTKKKEGAKEAIKRKKRERDYSEGTPLLRRFFSAFS